VECDPEVTGEGPELRIPKFYSGGEQGMAVGAKQ
jgi:hypothetical protein